MSKAIEIKFTNFHMSIEAGAVTIQFDKKIETLTMDHELAYGVGMLLLHASGIIEMCVLQGIEPDQSMLPSPDDYIAVVQLPPKFLKVCENHRKHPNEMLDALVGIFQDGDKESASYMMLALLNYIEEKDKRQAKDGIQRADQGRDCHTEITGNTKH